MPNEPQVIEVKDIHGVVQRIERPCQEIRTVGTSVSRAAKSVKWGVGVLMTFLGLVLIVVGWTFVEGKGTRKEAAEATHTAQSALPKEDAWREHALLRAERQDSLDKVAVSMTKMAVAQEGMAGDLRVLKTIAERRVP